MDDKIIDLAKKLNELAKRGEGGEKENADRMLQQLMKKHGISLQDIETEALNKHAFIVRPEQSAFFGQLVSTVLGKNFSVWGDKKNKKKVYLETTAADAIEIYAKFDFYWKLWTKDLDAFRYAFYSRHNLFPLNDPGQSPAELTHDQLDKLNRAEKLKRGLSSDSYRRQISSKNSTQLQ